jgi:patatin-related protein
VDLVTVTQTAGGATTPRIRSGAGQELRLALALRGGVSLAVWIGGAVAEIERLRLAGIATDTGDDPHPIYASLLELAGYSSVLVDVLAGASAGGLNAAVYAAAQCHGFDVGEMRDVWMSMGDIETSSRATTSAGRAAESAGQEESADEAREIARRQRRARDAVRPPSLLDGDGYFFRQLAAKLKALIDGAKADGARGRKRVDQIDLLLSATLFTPRDIHLLLNRHNRVQETGSEALFRFRRAPGQDDLAVGRSSEPLAESLAMAARSTSSFPIAFEPACVSVGTGRLPDFGRTFQLPGGKPVGDVAVIDGGTLDNIPVTAAIRAIVDSPAQGPTERWLFYLHPSPPDPPATDEILESGLNSPGAVATVVQTLTARFGVESLLDDVRELEAVNEAARRRRLTMAAAFGALRSEGEELVDQLTTAWQDRAEELAEIWLALDISAVVGALRRPSSGDAIDAGLDDAPLAGWADEDQLALAPALQTVLRPVEQAKAWRSSAWLEELTRLLVSWARSVEYRVDDPDPTGLIKAQAYRLRAVAGALERAQRLQWLTAAKDYDSTTTVEVWAGQTWSDMLQRVPGRFARRLPRALTSARELDGLLADLDDNLRDDGDRDLGEAIWLAGLGLAKRLVVLGAEAPGQEPGLPGWEIFRRLETLADPAQLGPGLASVVTLSAPLALLGPAPDSEVRFAQMTGRTPTPLHWRFHQLKERRARQSGSPARGAPLRPSDKLCGDKLGNFAALLSAKWRANDWMWGRLDAAATLVDNLLDPERLAHQRDARTAQLLTALDQALAGVPDGWAFAGLPRAARRRLEDGPGEEREFWDEWVAAVTQVRDCVVERLHWEILSTEVPMVNKVDHHPPPEPPAVEPLKNLEDTKKALAGYDVGLQGLGDLGDKRRVRLFLRAALVAFGTLRPDGPNISAVAGRWAASLLKPLYLIAVFVAASLRRGLFVAAIALGSLQATYWRAEHDLRLPGWPSWTAAVAGLAILVLLSAGFRKQRSARLLTAGALIGLAVLFALWAAGPLWAVSTLVAVGLAGATAMSAWRHVKRGTATWRDLVLYLYAVTIAAGAGGVVLGGTRAVCRSGCDDWASFAIPFVVLAAVALVVAATGTFWMRWRCRVAVLLLVLGAYAGTAGPFAGDSWPSWAQEVATAAAAALAAGLTGLAVRDGWRRDRLLGKRPGVLRLAVAPILAGALAYALASTTVPWPRGVWVILAVATAGYSLTVLATYVDVLLDRPRPAPPEGLGPAAVPLPAVEPAPTAPVSETFATV